VHFLVLQKCEQHQDLVVAKTSGRLYVITMATPMLFGDWALLDNGCGTSSLAGCTGYLGRAGLSTLLPVRAGT
jgi:hypothetical protein